MSLVLIEFDQHCICMWEAPGNVTNMALGFRWRRRSYLWVAAAFRARSSRKASDLAFHERGGGISRFYERGG